MNAIVGKDKSTVTKSITEEGYPMMLNHKYKDVIFATR